MNTTNQTEDRERRDATVINKAITFALSQGYSTETARGFADYAVQYCPEVQSYGNLFDCYINKITSDNAWID